MQLQTDKIDRDLEREEGFLRQIVYGTFVRYRRADVDVLIIAVLFGLSSPRMNGRLDAALVARLFATAAAADAAANANDNGGRAPHSTDDGWASEEWVSE